MVYGYELAGKAWGLAWYMVWLGGNGIWYALADKAWCMVWPGGHGMIYAMAWRTLHGIWFGLADIAWYMVRPGEVYHGMWRGRGIVLHALRHCHGL